MDITRKAAVISLAASIAILALKFWAYSVTHSTAVLSDALESIVNVLSAAVAFQVMRVVARPADENHPYGHGKFEFFSMAFEGGLITFAGLVIAQESVKALMQGSIPRNLDAGLIISAIGALANLALGAYLLLTGRRHRSEALHASGVHVMTDVATTAGVIMGLALVRFTGLAWFDPVAALILAGLLVFSGYRIVRRAAAGMTDEVEPTAINQLTEALEKNRRPGIIDVHQMRVIRSGRYHHVDAHLVVPEFWSVLQAHAVADEFEKSVVRDYPYDGEIAFHLDPCEREYCTRCSVQGCPVRRKEFTGRQPFAALNLTHPPQKDLA